MPRRRNSELDKIRAFTNTTCQHCPTQIRAPKDLKARRWLLLKDQRRSDSYCLEVDSDIHTVGNCYELNAPPTPKSLRSMVSIPLISPLAPLRLDQR